MAVQVVRMDRRLAGRGAGAVDIETEVFHLGASARTPQWIPGVPLVARRRFFDWQRTHAPGPVDCFVASRALAPSMIRDRLGHPISDDERVATMFFVDRVPAANWGHPCTYVFVRDDGQVVVIDHDFPPSRSAQLVPIRPLRG